MEFHAPNDYVRPMRLSEATRRFAFDSLHHRYGSEALAHHAVPMDDAPGFETLSDIEKYDRMIRTIAERAPVRICENERVSGAATLGTAIDHKVPATLRGEPVFNSVSHLTVDFASVLQYGVNEIKRRAQAAYEQYRGTEREPFAKSCLACIEAFELWHARYLDALRARPEFRANFENLLRVPFPASKRRS
ncbi:MAG: hypothetical protein IK118_01900 [Clostridia bacterium]|nr:hypothetical protein [Clostridia bacterium]